MRKNSKGYLRKLEEEYADVDNHCEWDEPVDPVDIPPDELIRLAEDDDPSTMQTIATMQATLRAGESENRKRCLEETERRQQREDRILCSLRQSGDVNFHFRKLWNLYEKKLWDEGLCIHELTPRWFAALLKWRAEEREGMLSEYSKLGQCVAKYAGLDNNKFLAFTAASLGVAYTPEAVRAAGYSTTDLSWSSLMGREINQLHHDLINRLDFFLACCATEPGERNYWKQLSIRCAPTAEVVEVVLELVHLMSLEGSLFDHMLMFTSDHTEHISSYLCRHMATLAAPRPDEEVADLFCGDGTLLVALYKHIDALRGQGPTDASASSSGTGEGYADHLAPLREMNMRLHGVPWLRSAPPYPGAHTHDASLRARRALSQYHVVANSTTGKSDWGQAYHRQPYAFAIEHTLKVLRSGGRATMLVPREVKQAIKGKDKPYGALLANHKYSFRPLPPLCIPVDGDAAKNSDEQPVILLFTKTG